MRMVFALGTLMLAGVLLGRPASGEITFERDVQPVLQKHCQHCHRPGEIGPMSLVNYEQVRPWAKAIRESVLLKKMPPWFADPNHGKFSNDRSLTQAEIDTLVGWADTGARQGDPTTASAPTQFVAGWQIGKPDVIFELAKEFPVPASGVVPYKWMTVPTGFTEDKWIQAVEVRPGNPAVLHHAVVYSRDPDSQYARDYPNGEFFEYIKEIIRMGKPKHRTMLNPPEEPVTCRPGPRVRMPSSSNRGKPGWSRPARISCFSCTTRR